MTKKTSGMQRRSFLKMGLAGVAGLSAAPMLQGKNGGAGRSQDQAGLWWRPPWMPGS